MRDKWKVSTGTNVREALKVLTKTHVDILVTETRLKEISGFVLLSKVKEIYPDMARIILSGYADRDVILKSVEIAHQYISKPCEMNDLKEAIDKALMMRDLLSNDAVKSAVSNIDTLPSIPSLYTEIIDELNSEDPSIKKIGDIVSQDIGMSAKMLQLVNSSFFGIPQRVINPEKAVNMLGVDLVKAIALTSGAFSKYEDLDIPGFSLDRLWEHCLNAGSIAKQICGVEGCDKKFIENAFMATLLHDVGTILIAKNFPYVFSKIIAESEESNRKVYEIEKELLGATHADIGAYLLGLWGLPKSIIEAVANHHQPYETIETDLSILAVVHTANALERAGDSVCDEDVPISGVDYAYLEEFKLADKFKTWRKTCADLINT